MSQHPLALATLQLLLLLPKTFKTALKLSFVKKYAKNKKKMVSSIPISMPIDMPTKVPTCVLRSCNEQRNFDTKYSKYSKVCSHRHLLILRHELNCRGKPLNNCKCCAPLDLRDVLHSHAVPLQLSGCEECVCYDCMCKVNCGQEGCQAGKMTKYAKI